MGYRQLLKKFMQEVELLLGSSLVEELAHCHGLSQRELNELRVIAMEASKEASKEGTRAVEISADANYHAIALSLFDAFQISIPDFLDSYSRELDETRAALSTTPLQRVDLASLRVVIASIGRHSHPLRTEPVTRP